MRGHKPRPAVDSPRRSVGVRELKAHAAKIVRSVRETGASYVVTHRGRAVGILLPIDAGRGDAPGDDAAWTTFLEAGRQLQRRIRPGTSAVKLLSDSRR